MTIQPTKQHNRALRARRLALVENRPAELGRWELPAAFMLAWHCTLNGLDMAEISGLIAQHEAETGERTDLVEIGTDPAYRDGHAEAAAWPEW